MTGSERNFSVIIGKKRINLYKGSGISDTRCVKIRKESYVTLPGGFRLPIMLVEEQLTYYDTSEQVEPNVCDYAWMYSFAKEYLQEQMIAGLVLDSSASLSVGDSAVSLYGEYDCREMIGRLQSEEIVQRNGKSS